MNPVTAINGWIKTKRISLVVAGFVNIESGNISFAPDRPIHQLQNAGKFGSEDNCKICGSNHGFQIPSGMGDGLYTVAEVKNHAGECVGLFTTFDAGEQFARNCRELSRFDYPSFEIPADWEKRRTAGVYLGSMANLGTVFVSDETCGWPSTNSVLDVNVSGDILSVFAILEETPKDFEEYQEWLEDNFEVRDTEDPSLMANLLMENDDEGRYAGRKVRSHRSHVVRAMLIISSEHVSDLSSHFSDRVDLIELELSYLSGVSRSHLQHEDRSASMANALLQLMSFRTGASEDETKAQSWLLQNAMSYENEPGWALIAENFPNGSIIPQIELAKMRWSVSEASFDVDEVETYFCNFCDEETDLDDTYCSNCGEFLGG